MNKNHTKHWLKWKDSRIILKTVSFRHMMIVPGAGSGETEAEK